MNGKNLGNNMISFIFAICLGLNVSAKDLSILYIGNSYTYVPTMGDELHPAVPKIVNQIAQSIEPTLQIHYTFHTPGGFSFEKHFHDPNSVALMSQHYDKVILQGQSIESLDLPLWWEQNFSTSGLKSFSVFLPKILDLVFKSSNDVSLYVNWGWNPKNNLLSENHPGLYFPKGMPKSGQKWCGNNKFEYQEKIDESYRKNSKNYSVHFAKVGDAWLSVQRAGLVDEDELYLVDDWSHPSALGTFIAALVLVRDSLRLDISKNSFIPTGMDPVKIKKIQELLL